ncbi:MAG: RNA polymerase-binding protein DksA, partial [Burkholderiales bacterium]
RYQAAPHPEKRTHIVLRENFRGNVTARTNGNMSALQVSLPEVPISAKKRLSFFSTSASMAVELTRKSFTPYAPKKGEEYMNARQRTHYRKILEQIKSELSEEIDRTVHTMQDEATVFADPNDRASQESDMALELRNRDRERKLIKKIDETIGRIDANEYGYCDSCGVEIGLKRLEARPTATLCIDCKTLDELREKQVAK